METLTHLYTYIISLFVIYLTPFIPLSFKGEGEIFVKRGFASL